MDVHQAAELVQVAALQRALALAAEVFDEVQVFGHAFVRALALVILFLEDF